MEKKPIYAGETPLAHDHKTVSGNFTYRDGIPCYCIGNYDQMRPFFMSIVSAADQWMFISSKGALTAGRRNPHSALFPYTTDDKIHDAAELTGSKTIFRVEGADRQFLWEPFSERHEGMYRVERKLYKSVYGDQLIFEEYNRDLELTFSYSWASSDRWGFVKRAQIRNTGPQRRIRVLDGIQQLMPYGVSPAMQTELSTLIDAYKKNELEAETGLGMYMLSSILVDRPEPSEALKATTVWSVGMKGAQRLLSSLQLDRFRRGEAVQQETDIRAERGAYFLEGELLLPPGDTQEWLIVADVNQGPSDVVASLERLQSPDALTAALEADITQGTERLVHIVAAADGLQLTQDPLTTTRHYANVLFNVMRGGIFDDQYQIEKADLIPFIAHFNRAVFAESAAFFQSLPDAFSLAHLLEKTAMQAKPQLRRLCYEYLPLTFSRRHGDPSRPWNAFSIDTRDENGAKILSFQGNWRDIFQNWEALCRAYPGFTESIICKFVNASTADGYNPYRITREGIDWEVIDPHDPWSFIGYWGDHQLVYLLKLMELSRAFHPGKLQAFLSEEIFAYAHVPYQIKPYEALLADPRDTIIYDTGAEKEIEHRVVQSGADGKLIWQGNGQVYLVNFAEKLLVPILAKLANFIPGAGIWMNTQRPEWNDANNALVGYGVSVVTLCYLRRFLVFFHSLLDHAQAAEFAVSEEVAAWLGETDRVLEAHQALLSQGICDPERKTILDGLGAAASTYRATIYEKGFSGKKQALTRQAIMAFLDRAQAYVDRSIAENVRPNRLYHAYNLMRLSPDGKAISIRRLDEMLEGQVAVLSSGYLTIAEVLEVLSALKSSALYREDQYSYLLYPDRQLPRFLEKNRIPAEQVQQSLLLMRLLEEGRNALVEQDVRGGYHFNGAFRNAGDVRQALDRLAAQGYESLVQQESGQVLALFETVFDHASFTGRSGTFYGYEGLGSIYWHMVSKLLLAVGEVYYQARDRGEAEAHCGRLIEHYYDIRAGIGFNKPPEVYGAFPTDPYSHTPGNAGAQQPGMTGQVKEDILARWLELGLEIREGEIHFRPILLRSLEFLQAPASFACYSLSGEAKTIGLPAHTLAFTCCQVPVIYHQSPDSHIRITFHDGSTQEIRGLSLGKSHSAALFAREDSIEKIEVWLMSL